MPRSAGNSAEDPELTLLVVDFIRRQKHSGKTQKEISVMLGCSEVHVSKIFNGSANAGLSIAKQLAKLEYDGSLDRVLVAAAELAERVDKYAVTDADFRIRARKGFAEAIREAREAAPNVPAEVWTMVADLPLPSDMELTPAMLAGFANALHLNMLAHGARRQRPEPNTSLRRVKKSSKR